MPVSSSTEHWIRPDALTINLNHFGNPDYLQVSVLAGAVVMAFKQDVIGYNAAHNYRTWPLNAANTYLETTSAVNVYAKLTRSEVNAQALIAYDTVLRDIEGREITYGEDGSEVLGDANPDYFFAFLGQISASVNSNGESVQREWTIDFRAGNLDTNQYRNEESTGEWSKMFRLNKVTDLIEILKNISSAVINKLTVAKDLVLFGKSIVDVKRSTDTDEDVSISDETIPTTLYVDKRYNEKFLRKDQDDRTPHNLGVGGNLEVDGDASTGDNQTVGKNLEVGGTATIGSDTTIGGQTTMQKKATAKKGLQIGESFVPGILTGSGGFFDEFANGEVESLIIRRFLEVPELRFNRVEIKLGDKWNAPGAGIFESVVPDTDNTMTGTGYLKLEEGEYGAIAVGDICMGIFHSEVSSENATADSDDSRGNFQFAGFYTCYFTITEITGKDNKQFRYQLRPVSDRWKLTYHPSAQMTFVSYGSFSRTDRQTSVYTTRTYTRLLKNQNTWEISAANIAMQYGNMENMSIHGLDMTGYSMYLNNIYMTGIVRQVRPDGTPVMVVNDRGEYQSGTTYAYYDRVSYQGSLWLVVNESGTNTVPSKGDASWLLQVEAGVGIKSAGQWQTANTPYKANTIVTFADSVWISNKETSEAPFPIYTDNQGNRLTYNDGGYILVSPLIQSADWDLLLSAPDLTKGEDGKSIEVRYSADKTNWHSTFQEGDIYMQQRIGSDGVWSNAMRFVGETGKDGTDGIYSEFQFAKNTSMTAAPTTGWQDGPPSIGNGEYLWMRQRVVNPNEGTTSSWQTARIKGDTGDDGEGFTNMGPWRTGMTVPKMGVVTMGGSVYVAKVATTNPPLWCYTDNQGNRLLFNDGGYILTGEVNTAEYELWVEKPKDGKDGKDGINGTNGKDGKDGKDGEDGKQGIQGCIVRDSEWAIGVNYRNDEALTSGTRWLDVALIRDDSAATGWRAYKCKVTHTSSTANAPGNNTYWEEFSANFTAIFTSLIIAKNAKITFLQGNQLLIQEDNGTITAGLSGSNEGNAYRFWAGAETPEDAPFRVDKYGNANIEGTIHAGSMSFKTIRNGGSMEGYTFGQGPGTYVLPSPAAFRQVHIFGKFPPYLQTDKLYVQASGKAAIAHYSSDKLEMTTTQSTQQLSLSTMYTFTCMPSPTPTAAIQYIWLISKMDVI